MKSIAIVPFVVAAVVTVTSCDDNKTSPSAQPVVFTAALTAAQEVPPITDAESTAAGTATITFNLTRDNAQTITAATADFQVNLTGFPAGSSITLAHIHQGVVGVPGNVVVNTGLASGQVPLTNGAGSFTRTGITVTPDVAQAIIDNPSAYYFNVHSALHPTGVIRGQLVKQ